MSEASFKYLKCKHPAEEPRRTAGDEHIVRGRRRGTGSACVEAQTPRMQSDSLVADVFLGERDVLDQHGRLGAEEDPEHRLRSQTSDQ